MSESHPVLTEDGLNNLLTMKENGTCFGWCPTCEFSKQDTLCTLINMPLTEYEKKVATVVAYRLSGTPEEVKNSALQVIRGFLT